MNANNHIIPATVLGDIAAERSRQVEVEGWTPEHDDEHDDGEMAQAAACYALGAKTIGTNPDNLADIWPWHRQWWKPSNRRRNLVKAAALLIAEIERLDRAASAMSAGTAATTQIGAGRKPASAVANGETPKPRSQRKAGAR